MSKSSVTLFVLAFLVIISMYGGGFATVPAYLKDMFGTRYVGAIHGWLITAWSMAGIFGPVLVNYIRQYQIDHGVPKAQAYNVTMYVMAALLVIGFLCNLFIKAVHARYHMEFEGENSPCRGCRSRQSRGGSRGRRLAQHITEKFDDRLELKRHNNPATRLLGASSVFPLPGGWRKR